MTDVLCYGVPEGCSFGSIVAMEWLGRPFRLCRIEMPEVVSGEAYRRVNPIGETPTLITSDGAVLSESMAILGYLGARFHEAGKGPAPGSAAFDRRTQMLAYLNTSFFNAFSPLWFAMEHDMDGPEKDALTRYGRQLVEKTHAGLETLLGEGPYLMGAEPEIVDAYFMGIARWADFHQAADRRDYPGIDGLYNRLKQDPAVQFAWAIEHEEPATSAGGFKGHVTLDHVAGLLGRQAA